MLVLKEYSWQENVEFWITTVLSEWAVRRGHWLLDYFQAGARVAVLTTLNDCEDSQCSFPDLLPASSSVGLQTQRKQLWKEVQVARALGHPAMSQTLGHSQICTAHAGLLLLCIVQCRTTHGIWFSIVFFFLMQRFLIMFRHWLEFVGVQISLLSKSCALALRQMVKVLVLRTDAPWWWAVDRLMRTTCSAEVIKNTWEDIV